MGRSLRWFDQGLVGGVFGIICYVTRSWLTDQSSSFVLG